jgi:hypothetical protein
MKPATIIILALMIGVVAVACTNQPGNTAPDTVGNVSDAGNPPGRYGGNLTPEERQQAYAQMMQQAIAACDGKATGDSCVIQNPRGERNGTCEAINETNDTLSCRGSFRRPTMPQQ